ncbi:MAG: DUF4367 domain-containing protein [Faecousia sp.]
MSKTEWKPFEQALLDAVLEEYAGIPSEEEIDIAFSSQFEEKNPSFVQKSRSRKKPRLSTGVRRAILIAAIIAALTITAMAAPAIREAIIKFFARNEGTHFEFDFDPEVAATAPKYIETAYKPYYIPEGYTLSNANVNFGAVMYDWKDSETSNYIGFTQIPIPLGNTSGPNAEGVHTDVLNLAGYEVFYVEKYSVKTYCWTNNEYFFYLTCTEAISTEEMQRIFLSIAIDTETVIEYY